MTRVKICGIQSREDALAALQGGAHALGFIFAPSRRRINPELAREIILNLPPFITKVGVFVNEERHVVQEIASLCNLDVLQFHGEESPAYCQRWFQQTVKSFRVKNGLIPDLEAYGVDAILLDTYVEGQAGGTGQTFDWNIAAEIGRRVQRPLIMAGGLNCTNVGAVIRQVRPYAIDLASGVENEGRKDPAKITAVMREVRKADEELA